MLPQQSVIQLTYPYGSIFLLFIFHFLNASVFSQTHVGHPKNRWMNRQISLACLKRLTRHDGWNAVRRTRLCHLHSLPLSCL